MSKSAELRAEIAHLRALLRDVTDEEARNAVLEMIGELERRAHDLDNGSSAET
jgi:hypothetical protein